MISDCRCVFIGVKSPGSGINGRMLRMGENGIKAGISNFCSARPGAGEICRLPRGNVGRGSWRAGRPPDLFDGRRRYRGGKFRLLWCAVGSGGDMQAAARECWSWEQEGRSPSRPLRIGEDGTGEGEPRFCGAQSGRRRYAELLRGFDARGSRRAGRPPDLPAREKNKVG